MGSQPVEGRGCVLYTGAIQALTRLFGVPWATYTRGRMDLHEFERSVRNHLRERSTELGLISESVQVDYLLNWGGFVNRSFRISDGHNCFHLKLANRPETRDALRRWRNLGDALRPYHAPPIVAWVDLPLLDSAGPLTEWIDGSPPARITRELADRILPTIASLHADANLAARLGVPSTCAQTYLDTYGDRFAGDLREVSLHRPPFVSNGAMRLMREEATRLEDIARTAAAFKEVAYAPIHADLWANNFLVRTEGDWYLMDWDDLRVGDPALDFAMLLGPSAADLRPLDCANMVEPFLASDAQRERLAFYERASLLDWVIDSLADYVDAGAIPEHSMKVWAEKERIHVEAFDLYATIYL